MSDPLYTGAHSGSFTGTLTKKLETETVKRTKESKNTNKAKLLPAYEVVSEHIDKEIARVKDLDSFYLDATTPEELHRELSARKAYVAYLSALKNYMQTLVRDK